jgi:hypothetical protein
MIFVGNWETGTNFINTVDSCKLKIISSPFCCQIDEDKTNWPADDVICDPPAQNQA